MTVAIEEGTTSAPTQTLTRWLTELGRALETGDVEATTGLFNTDSYWRDLVTFTWNITTVEGHAGIADLPHATLSRTQPRGFSIEGEAAQSDGIIEGRFTFETARPGDSWRKRYKSLCLHDPVWYDHLPYLPFPDHWPVFSPKDKIGDWLEMYARVMELNYWGSTIARHAAYDATTGDWSVDVVRDGSPVTLRPKHLVFATGVSGLPVVPTIAGAETFEGDQYHSSEYASGESYRGKKAVVIGSNNSAHDICADLWEHGVDVTMVQRSPTHVARSDTLLELALGALYSESAVAAGVTTDKADLLFASVPYRLLGPLQVPVCAEMARRDSEFYARLEKAGFLLDFGEDGVNLLRIKPHSVVLDDGSELDANLIVYATGYGSMNGYWRSSSRRAWRASTRPSTNWPTSTTCLESATGTRAYVALVSGASPRP